MNKKVFGIILVIFGFAGTAVGLSTGEALSTRASWITIVFGAILIQQYKKDQDRKQREANEIKEKENGHC